MEQRQILFGILLLAVLYFVFIHNTEKLENVASSTSITSMTSMAPTSLNPVQSMQMSQATEAIQILANTAVSPMAASPSQVIPIANTAIAPMTSQSGVGAVQQLSQQALSPMPAPIEQVNQAVNVAMNAINTPAPVYVSEPSTNVVQASTPTMMMPVQNAMPSSPPMSIPVPNMYQSAPMMPTPASQGDTSGNFLMSTPAPIFEGFTQEEPPQTVFGVRNAFTGLRCYDESLPIVSVDSNTFTCISKDGKNCLTRDELRIPNKTEVVNGKLVKSTVLCRNRDNRSVTTWVAGNPYNIGNTVMYQGVSYLVINNIPADKTQLYPSHKDAERFWKKTDDVNTYLAKDGIRQLAGGASNANTRDVFNDLDANGYYTMECTLNGLNDPNHWCSKVYGSVDKMCNSWVNPDGTPDIFTKNSIPECSGTLQTYRDSWKKLTPAQIPPPPPSKSTLWKRPPVNVAPAPGAAPGALEISSCRNKTCLRNRPAGMDLKTCQTNCSNCGKTKC
jgi:hypothetical protein